ncbi:MAG: TetR/AcrR family transcriptional regulator [Bacteroidales bacterium]|jgi:AcrR family transcriptional regulator|nr:TetR/AcrR family transcriptional regulator [Bacteroidales bacterium]MCK9448912.1 TetR/AcrR family transcriptional regulator [Bacteroidales bacterium]MDD3701329.1 TetR/AcrR family transcriptional regulator [Bacteroidales bacterium]MDY0370059.1 TetR/AcrR family transcriptional regulator [Bacteroidales bacterium]
MGSVSTKDIIVEVAGRLFSRYGFHKTSMDEIARTARKAKGSLYYHFASKEELFREVIFKEFESFKNQLEIITTDTRLSAFEKIKHYLLKRMEILNTATNYHETLQADFFEKFHFVDQLRNDLTKWEKEKLHAMILQGIAKGEIKLNEHIDVLLDMLLMVLKGLEIPFFLQKQYNNYAPYFEGLIDILNKGIST